jgi:hypothetical protein
MEPERKHRGQGFADGVVSSKILEQPDGSLKQLLFINASAVVISITNGTDTVQLGRLGGHAIFVPGNIHQFANMLSVWANNLLIQRYPEVKSEVYSKLGMLEQLQDFSNQFIENVRWGNLQGVSTSEIKTELWTRFSKANLAQYIDKTERKNLRKSFSDALFGALKQYRKDVISRI